MENSVDISHLHLLHRIIEFKVQVIDRETGKEIPYRNYDQRSFARTISEMAR